MILCLVGYYGYAQNLVDTLENKIKNTSGLAKAEAYNEAVYFYIKRDLTKAGEYAARSIQFAKSQSNKLISAYGIFNRGIYFSGTGNIDSAIYFMEIARDMAKDENIGFKIKSGVGLGRNYVAAGQPGKALEILLESLLLMETHPDIESALKARVNIMWAYLELKRYSDCIQFGKVSLQQVVPQQEWIVPYMCNNIAASYGALKKLDSAKYYVELGIPIAQKYSDHSILANGYFILGNLYANSNQFHLALEQFQKAKPSREKMGNTFFMVADLYTISDLYYKLGEYENGIKAGLEGLALAEQTNLTLKFEGVYQVLAKNYEALYDYKNAAKFYSLLASIKDSVYQNSTADAMVEMQTKYEAEKKEMKLAEQNLKLRQNKWLIIFMAIVLVLILIIVFFWKRQNALKQKQELAIREKLLQTQLTEAVINLQEAERARFAKDLHDGMGQLISSIRLYIGKTNESWTHSVLELLDQAHREIREIAFALLPNTLTKEGLVPALHELVNRINSSGLMRIEVESTGFDERLSDKIELSLYRICQEWINNILKYGNAHAIKILLVNHTDTLTMIIEDNGDGFNPGKLEQGQGNGWKNIQSRVSHHKGTVFLESSPGVKGNSLIIEVPIPAKAFLNVA